MTAIPANSSFHPDLPTLQIAWDSTSIKAFKTCPRMYQLSIMEGYVPKAQSAHLVFGSAFHFALECYDHARSRGDSHEDATLVAVDAALRATWFVDRPWVSDIPEKTRFTLVRSVVWYLEEFGQDDTIQTVQLANGKPAVELSFRFQTDYTVNVEDKNGNLLAPLNYVLCGHIDRLGVFQDQTYVVDRKTTKHGLDDRFWAQFSPDIQFTLYVLAAQVVYGSPVKGLIVDGAQVMITFSRFARNFVPRTERRQQEFYRELGDLFHRAENYAMDNYWPMNETACGNYGGCPYRAICATDPSTRQEWIEGMYARRIWDPLQARGDI